MDNAASHRPHRDPLSGLARHVLAWMVMAAIMLMVASAWSTFQRGLVLVRSVPPPPAARGGMTSVDRQVRGTATVISKGVRLRSRPETSSVIVGFAARGETLEILSGRDHWYRVEDEAGRIGWVGDSTRTIEIRAR